MATMKCRTCGEGDSIAFCSETGAPICAKCAVSCDVCSAPLSKERTQLTSTGRKLCTSCMAARNARRREKKEEMRREASEKKRASASSAGPAVAPVAGVSFEDLLRDDPALSGQLRSVKREEAPVRVAAPVEAPKSSGTAFQDLLSKSPDAEEPSKVYQSASLVREAGVLDTGLEGEDGAKPFGLEGRAKEGSSRLALGPVDDNRPILTGSGYQPPTKRAYIAAFLFFGLAGAIFLSVAPGFREILMPWQTPRYAFSSGQLATAGDTNALRNTSNLSQFDVFSQAPIFFAAWFFVILYVGGAAMIIWSVGRSMMSSYLSKRRLKKAEEYAKKHGYSYPG